MKPFASHDSIKPIEIYYIVNISIHSEKKIEPPKNVPEMSKSFKKKDKKIYKTFKGSSPGYKLETFKYETFRVSYRTLWFNTIPSGINTKL